MECTKRALAAVVVMVLTGVGSAGADWHTLVIRNATTSGNPPAINDNSSYGVPAKEFVIAEGGQKAAWGTSDLDGHKVGEIAQLLVARLDDRTRFTAGSGPYCAPYFNIWITDGAGKYAVIGNEPSDAVFQALYSGGYDLSWADIADKTAKAYENSDKTWLPNSGVGMTFADLADFVIQAPTVGELTTGWPGLGGGAPRELGTNVAYGFNWVLGDTLSNYVSGAEGYVLAQPAANPYVTTRCVVSPQMLALGKAEFSPPHGTGANPFAYDWDSAAPITAAGAPTAYGASSFYASVAQAGATQPDRYRTFRIGLRTLFGHNVTIGQLSKLSYYTKKPADQTGIDWRFSIYTTAGDLATDPNEQVIGPGDIAKWYRNRIQNHAPAALNLNAPADQWNLWSTAVGTNQIQFYTNRPGFTAEDIAFSELTTGTVTRGGSTWDFSGEEVMMIDVCLGANSGGGTGESQVDGIRIELLNGQTADIDLTAGTTWKVATVHGHDQFTIDDNGNSLLYHQQPRNTQGWYWYNNNGSPPGTLATGGKQVPNGYRDGSRTFACSNVAIGQPLNSIKLVLEYDRNPTINFFVTDGNGKFGIFAPTSGGLASVGQSQILGDGWTRMTIDLTRTDILDTTTVAVYEHNGFVDEYGDPFTTMTWGDIKNYTIAGMYDYQRSPTHGWNQWGTMFDEINQAGVSTLTNGYGLALIWGDTVGNDAYALNQVSMRNVQVSFAGIDYAGTFADAQISDVLELNVLSDSVYLKPGESLVVHMDVSNLAQKVNACQALLGYNSDFFNVGSVAAGGGVWDELIYQSWAVSGEINTAIGLDAQGSVGTDADGTIASITMTAKAHEGTTQMVFLPDVSDVKGTYLSDMSAQFVYPTKIDSTTIYVDGTNPAVTVIDPDGGEYLKGGQSSDITWSATDTNIDPNSIKIEYYDGSAWQTIATGEANDGTYTWNPVPSLNIDTARVRVTASDLAGNSASDESDATFTIDSIAPVVDSISANQGGPELTPSGVALQGTVFIAVATSDNLSGVAGAPTVTVTPTGGSAESATPTGESPPGTYNYTWSVGATTPNGQATITVSGLADRSGNVASDATDTFNINKNQITGQVQLEGFVGASRVVTFVATGGTTTKTWDLTLTGWASHITSYTLTDVPDGTTHLSAKTAWSLRRKLAVSLDGDGQAVVDFTGTEPVPPAAPGTGDYLRGGDLNGSNTVNVLDYSLMKTSWGGGATGDINGDGFTGTVDYSIMKSNWFQIGDSQ